MCDASMALPHVPQAIKDTTAPLFDVGDDDQCNTCKLVLVQASAALADPVSLAPFLHDTVLACSFEMCSKSHVI